MAGEVGRHRSLDESPAPEPATARRLWSAPGLLLVGWCALVVLLLVLRHVHAARLPIGTPYEVNLSYELGSDWLTVVVGLLVAGGLAVLWWFDTRQPSRATPAGTPVAIRWRPLLAAATAGVAVLTFLTLFRPLPTVVDCPTSRIIHLNSSMGIVWNCDSSLFQQVADDPRRLLEAEHPRQARPVYALIGFVLVQTVGRVAGLFGFDNWQGEDARPYVSLVLLNVLVLIAAVVLVARLVLSIGAPLALTALLGVVVAFNHLTLEWTLTPHQQVFAMLVPVATMLLARRALVEPPTLRTAALWGLGVGLGASAYGSWLIAVPVVALALMLRLRKASVRPVLTYAGGAAAPLVVWMLICRIVAGSYYNHEAVAYREFVWVLDAARQGPGELWHYLSSYLILSVRSVLGTSEIWLASVALAIGIVVAVLRRVGLRPTSETDRATLTAVGLTLAVSFLFLSGIGYYSPRLAITMLPPILVAVAWVWSRIPLPAPRVTIPAGAAILAGLWVASTLS